MALSNRDLWQRYQKYVCVCPKIGLTLDISRMNFSDGYIKEMTPRMQAAFNAMEALEKGAIANADENRMVGHYWLRDAKLAPTPEITAEIEQTLDAIKSFARDVAKGVVRAENSP